MNLEESIEKIVKSHGAQFYDVERVKENGEWIYRVYITREGGVDLDLCADISSDISPMLDVHPPMQEHYFLEVSSPGIERKLNRPAHYEGAIGERITFKARGAGRKSGRLLYADDEGFTIEEEGGQKRYLYSETEKARTIYDWDREDR